MVEYLSGDHIIHRLVSSNTSSENDLSNEKMEIATKPKLVIKKDDKGVLIMLEKSSLLPVRIFSKRGSDDGFTLIGETKDNQFIDTRDNLFNAPELREYMAYHVRNNIQDGPTSDVVLIIKK